MNIVPLNPVQGCDAEKYADSSHIEHFVFQVHIAEHTAASPDVEGAKACEPEPRDNLASQALLLVSDVSGQHSRLALVGQVLLHSLIIL